ncbi:ABC transporter permease [Actinocrinis puniceicyclus]|uniref:Transport permease protein n=2 Tax=Actinocrinis puniceicyclus TaxID=977794 RepID=A0A8J7WJB8_9ACTN|nr:ABC transporter permease [Actinocrinis puniceicyclus]MBS2961970.1 ABC transporter permease [Actinocrinis puniceicyclus]
MLALTHTWYMTQRHFRAFVRQPMYVAFTLVQPVIWLFLFGQLFKRVTELPGFGEGVNYVTYLAPAIVVMSALFGSGWGGMSILEDLNRGVIDRFLVSPVSRGSLIAGRLIVQGVATIIQAVIILLLGALAGADYRQAVLGALVLLVAANLLATAIGSLSYGLALVARKEESIIAVSNFVLLPLQFLSTGFMAAALIPGWIRSVAAYNPVNWTLTAGRGALMPNPDWGSIGAHLGYLALFVIACGLLSTRAFRSYQRSI